MKIQDISAISLSIVEREATENKRAWSALDFVIVGESSSRRVFIDREKESDLLNAVRTTCSEWGTRFTFDGDVAPNGTVKIAAVHPTQAK